MRSLIFCMFAAVATMTAAPVLAQGYQDPWPAIYAIDAAENDKAEAEANVTGLGQAWSTAWDRFFALDAQWQESQDPTIAQMLLDAVDDLDTTGGHLDTADGDYLTGSNLLAQAWVQFGKGNYSTAEYLATEATLEFFSANAWANLGSSALGDAGAHLDAAEAALGTL